MKRASFILLGILLLLACGRQGIRYYWDTHSTDYADIRAAEDQFAAFAELAVEAPEKEALAALDRLFDQLKQDEVGYCIYADWMAGAFYSLYSPCRSPLLFSKAVDRIVADGIVPNGLYEQWVRQRGWIQYNQVGEPATVPGLITFEGRTLVLLLDLGCPSCRAALEVLGADTRWAACRHVAVGLGFGPEPDVPGWEYLHTEESAAVFDPHLTPVYFVVAADGTVEIPYTPAPR